MQVRVAPPPMHDLEQVFDDWAKAGATASTINMQATANSRYFINVSPLSVRNDAGERYLLIAMVARTTERPCPVWLDQVWMNASQITAKAMITAVVLITSTLRTDGPGSA